MQSRKQTLHLQELYSSAQAFLARSAKIRNINVAHFAEQKRLASRNSQKCIDRFLWMHFCLNSRLACPRSDYTSLSCIPLKVSSICTIPFVANRAADVSKSSGWFGCYRWRRKASHVALLLTQSQKRVPERPGIWRPPLKHRRIKSVCRRRCFADRGNDTSEAGPADCNRLLRIIFIIRTPVILSGVFSYLTCCNCKPRFVLL